MTASAVTPPGGDDHVITLLIPHRPGHKPAELVHDAGDFMTRGDGRRNVSVFPEVSVDELHIGTAHSTRPDLDEHLTGLNVRNGHVFENEGFVIRLDAGRFHFASCCPWVSSTGTGRSGRPARSDSCECIALDG